MKKILLNNWDFDNYHIELFSYDGDIERFDVFIDNLMQYTASNKEPCYQFILNTLQGYYRNK